MSMDISALKSKKIVELNELAKDLKIDGVSDLRKQDLIFKILEAQTENAIMEGFKIENKTNKMVTLTKAGNFGNPLIHVIIFVFTGWWSLLITNIIYAVYCYMSKAQNRMIKIE